MSWRGTSPKRCIAQMAATLDEVIAEIRKIQSEARTKGFQGRPAWPMIILRSRKGWTCPAEIDGKKCEDYWRSHQVPMSDMDKPEHVRILEGWMKSYRPQEVFDANGRLEAGIGGTASPRAFAHERQPARQRRPAAQGLAHAGLSRLRDRAAAGRAPRSPRRLGCRANSCAT